MFSRNFHNAQVSLGFFGIIHSSRFYRAAPWPVLQKNSLESNIIAIFSYFIFYEQFRQKSKESQVFEAAIKVCRY